MPGSRDLSLRDPHLANAVKPSVPLLGLPGASRASESAEDFAGLLSTVLPLQVHRWDGLSDQSSFANSAGIHHLNGITLLATHGTAVSGDIEQKHDAQVIIAYGSADHHYRVQQRDFHFSEAALFVPATGNRVLINSSICSAIVINVAPDSLIPVAEAMAGTDPGRLPLRSVFEQTSLLCRHGNPRAQRLLALMESTIQYIDQCLMLGGGLHTMLQLDDLIRRLIVMMLLPDLLEPAAAPPLISERFVHQDLIDWLLAHLHEPISLSCIEARSHYSRRSLQ